jgi:hypothetical protein
LSNFNSINPFFDGVQSPLDSSNTPIVPDGTREFITRGTSFRMQNGFVIFIDVLGIKGVWKRMSPDTVMKEWREIIGQFDRSVDNTLRHLHPYSTTLSDTIIITCECDISNINTIFQSIVQPFIYSINSDFFLRGTISYGITFISPRLILGPSIDEAAEWHSQLEWIGIATTPNLSNYYLSNQYEKMTNNYIYYPAIPIKKDESNETYSPLHISKKGYYKGLALNWFDKKDNLLQLMTRKKNSYSNYKIIRKYERTLTFFDYCIKSHMH